MELIVLGVYLMQTLALEGSDLGLVSIFLSTDGKAQFLLCGSGYILVPPPVGI